MRAINALKNLWNCPKKTNYTKTQWLLLRNLKTMHWCKNCCASLLKRNTLSVLLRVFTRAMTLCRRMSCWKWHGATKSSITHSLISFNTSKNTRLKSTNWWQQPSQRSRKKAKMLKATRSKRQIRRLAWATRWQSRMALNTAVNRAWCRRACNNSLVNRACNSIQVVALRRNPASNRRALARSVVAVSLMCVRCVVFFLCHFIGVDATNNINDICCSTLLLNCVFCF
mmetsp:Transcript_756/g.1187  ORF Transcript_756/g.1187 Transcript_756/m.1187 type:complete len:227 (+) Transcript_756:3887-4567(+)